MRCSAAAKTSDSTGPIVRSEVTMPGTSALVESASSRSTPSAPSLANPPRSVSRPSSGSWSILKSPVCRISPAGVLMATASASGMEWLTARNSRSQGPNRWVPPASTSTSTGVIRCSVSLLRTSASVSRDPTIGMSARCAQQVRHGADVILVRVREHERLDLVEPAFEGGEVRQDQVDAGLVVLGEQHAAVDDEQPAGVLEDGHVAADLAEAAERDQAQAVSG